jgi:hypothetical protein
MGGGGKSSTSSQTVSIPPEVLARYNAVNARAEKTAEQPFKQYGGEFVAPLTATQTAGIQNTSAASQLAQPYYGAATGLTMSGARDVGPLTQDQIGYYQNPFTQSVVNPTVQALQQQQGQQLAQQQAEAIKGGAFGGDRAGIQRAQLMGQQNLGMAQAIAPLYQQGYQQAVQTAQQQQGVVGSDLARRMQAGQQIAGLGTGAQQAALQGSQAQIGAGTLQQQTQQAQDTAQYQQFLQERGYDFQVAQFLANIAMGTGALSGSTTTSTQPRGFFSNRGGFKTGESLHRAGKAYGGGLDPNSMGGAVYQPGAFERGGYATSGSVVDSTDLAAILAQQRQSFGPFASAGPYGQAAGATPHGPSGIVPQQQLATPKLVTAGPLPKQQAGAGSDLGKMYSLADEATKGLSGKGLTERAGEKMGLRDVPKGANDVDVKDAGKTRDLTESEFKNLAKPSSPVTPDASTASSSGGFGDWVSGLFKAEGGGVMPRHHYADGGSEDSQGDEAVPYDPSDVMGTKDPMEGVLKAGSQKHEMLKPSGGGGGGGGGSSKLGLGKMAGSAIGSAFGPLGSMAGGFLGGLLPFNEGGVVPRQHHADGERAESDTPAVRTYSNEDLDRYGREAGQYQIDRESGGDPRARAKTSSAAGLGQFTDATARGVLQKNPQFVEGINYDPNARGFAATLPEDVQRKMVDAHARDQAAVLARTGIEPTPQNIRMNWFLGEAGGPAFLRRMQEDPSAPAHSLAGSDQVRANQNVFFNRDGSPRTAGEVYSLLNRSGGGGGGFGAGRPPADVGRPADAKGLGAGQEPGFFDRNKGIILPVLQGIGAMASSKSISPWAAALQGLGAGAKAYGDVEAQQAGIKQTEESTRTQEATTAANWITAAKSASFKDADGNAYVLTPKGKVLLSIYNQNPGYWGEPIAQPQMRAAVEKKPAAPPVEQDIYGEGAASKEKLPGTTGPSDQVKSNVEPQHIATSTPKFVSGAPTPYTLVGNNALQNIEVDKTRALSSNPEARALSAQESASQFKVINEEARKASSVAAQFDKLAESAMQLPETGLMSQGALLDMKSRWADYVNSILKTSNVGPDYWIAAKDVGTAQGMKKIQNALQLELGSKSIDALQTAVGAIPNANMSREGFIEAYAPERVRMQKAMDQARYVEDYRRAYDKKYGLSFNGGWSTANALRSFNDDNPQNQYDTDVARMKWLMSKKANENETYWSLYRSGKAPRHFSDRQTGGVGYRRYFEGYGQ